MFVVGENGVAFNFNVLQCPNPKVYGKNYYKSLKNMCQPYYRKIS